jgi:Domain of unknown function (DUF4082)
VTAYTLFGQSGGDTVTSDGSAVSLGMQFSLSQPAALTGIWFWSPPGAGSLPDACVIYLVSSATQVAGTLSSSPSWSGAAGSGWVKATYDGSVTLAAGVSYKVVVHHAFGSDFYGATSHYWDTGAGQNGQASGIITAPDNAGGDGGQDTFTAGNSLAYPSSSFGAANYWVDVEVSAGTADIALADAGADADAVSLAAAVPVADPGSGADAGSVAVTVPLTEPGAGDGVLAAAAALGLADPGGGTDGLAVPGSGSPALGDAGEAGDEIGGLRQSCAFPDAELLLIGWLQPQFPATRWCTELPADITETTVHVTRISGANRSLRVDRPIVDIDVFALDHATSVSVALGIQALLKVARNVVTGSGILQSANTVNGPRWLPEINPALRRRSATYELHVHA